MSLWAIIPVKPLNRAKSRLEDVLTSQQRADFAEAMLRHVLSVVSEVPQVTGTLVISRDPRALSIARDYRAKTVHESTPSDLNPALERATEVVRLWHGQAVLILPADLPFITHDDIATMAYLGMDEPTVVIATDQEQNGTNAMLVRPAGLINYHYGVGSFALHAKTAIEAGATLKYFDTETLTLDVDVPADLDRYNQRVLDYHLKDLPVFPHKIT